MNRRELMLLLGGAITAAPHALCAQQRAMPVIGYLGTLSGLRGPYLAAFHQGLSEA